MTHPTGRSRCLARAVRAVVPALLVLAMTCAAHAQPASRPGVAMPTRPNPRGGGGGPVTAEDVAAALEFAREHMPNLTRVIDESEPGTPTRRKMVRFALERWRTLERVQRDEPEEYEAALARVASHDEVFDLVRQLNEAAPEQRTELRAQVREKMRQIMLDLLEERERRIEGLRRMLGREEELLTRDRDRIDELTERRIEMLREELGGGTGNSGASGGTVPKSAGDLTPPDLATPSELHNPGAPSTAPSQDRRRRGQ